MDMQTKIICNFKNCINGACIQKKEIDINKIVYPDGYLGDNVIQFTEHTRVEIMLVSDKSDVQIEVESYDSEEMKVVKPGESIVLSPGGEQDNMLVPGYYSIIVKFEKNTYKGLYKVISSSIEWNALLNLRKCLEITLEGLSYNIYLQRKGHNGRTVENNLSVFQLYKEIDNIYNSILNNMDLIIKKPIVDIYKEYSIRTYSKKIDRRSQRWLSKKGQIYNINIYSPNISYEKHTELTLDVIENKMLKKILNYIYDILCKLYRHYSIIYSQLNNIVRKLQEEISELSIHYEEVKNVLNMKKARIDIEGKIRFKTRENDEYLKNIKVIEKYIHSIVNMKNLINYYRNYTWLNNIKECTSITKPTFRLLKHKHYGRIYDIYRKIHYADKYGVKNNTFPQKKTSKLFEIYNYILVKNIVEDIGFKWVDGWLKRVDDVLTYNGELVSGETILLEKDNYKIEIIYDKEVNTANEVKNTNISQLVSINSKSRRPDIVLSLYDGEIFKSSFIAEIKCRKKQFIYNKNEDTDVMYQLRDYTSFGYYDCKQKKILRDNIVSKIVIIYPKQEGKCKFTDELYDFSFIQVEPINLCKNVYGYEELKQEIENFLLVNGVIL